MSQVYSDKHMTLSELLKDAGLETGATLLIPDLQRPYVWTPRQVILLVDSLLRGWPFGSLLLWSVSREQVAQMPWRQFARVVDRVDDTNERVAARNQPADFRMVLDGQQRVQSLLLAFGGDNWGFKLRDKEWHESLKERRGRGRPGPRWSFGQMCLDLVELKKEIELKKRLAAVDFTTGPLTWAVHSASSDRGGGKRAANYDEPLAATDDVNQRGRHIRLSRLWELAGGPGLLDSSDYEQAVAKLLDDHQTPDALAAPLRRSIEDLLRKLREVRNTRVTFLEVDKFHSNMESGEYMDAVVNIFTRLNTAGRTLTREEITFAWVKSGWQPEKVNGRSASQCFDALRKCLKPLGLDLSLDDLMAGIAFVWAVVFREGKVLSQRDLLDERAVRPMAQQLSEEWNNLEQSLRATSEAIQKRDLVYERHYLSLNALAVLWAWRFLTERWGRQHPLQARPKDEMEQRLATDFAPLSDRWLLGSQWAGYWGAYSAQRVASLAAKLAELKSATDQLTEAAAATTAFSVALKTIVEGTQTEASAYIEGLSVDDRAQVRHYYTPLWVWHRLSEERWKMSAVPLRASKKQLTLDVDHVVAVNLWVNLSSAADAGEDPRVAMNELGNCLLLETAFNASKNDTALGKWLKEVHEFKTGVLTGKEAEWSAALSLAPIMLEPTGRSAQEVAAAVETRTATMKAELKEFITGVRTRVDV